MVACPPGEEDALSASAKFLNEKMVQARESGKILGVERLAVMTALNITHDYLRIMREHASSGSDISQRVRKLNERILESIGRRDEEE